MGNNIITSTLSNVCLQEKGSIISGPFGSNISRKFFVDFGVPVIRGNNLNTGLDNFNDHGFVFITKEKANELKCDALRGDVIFTAAGTIGQVGYVPYDSKYTRYTISNKQIRARLDTTKIDLLYAYYWLSGPWIFKLLNSNNKGSTVPLLTLSEVKNLPIHYPQDLNKQKMIGQLLDKMTQKINNNKKIISNLESLAKTIYDYWFLQFEFPNEEGKPYKSSGGKMVWNDELKREIPEGWNADRLCSQYEAQSGYAFKSKDWKENGKNVLTIKCIEENGNVNFSESSYIEENYDKKLDKYTATNGNLIFAMSGNTIGKIGIIASKDDKVLINQRVLILKTSFNSVALTYFFLKCEEVQNIIRKLGANSAQPNISEVELGKIKLAIPNNDLIKIFNRKCEPYFRAIVSLRIQNQQLTELRDFLLPMLMNGQVTFK